MMVYCFDLDGTLCSLTENNEYDLAIPIKDMVEAVNKLYESNYIKVFTARGASSGIDWADLTRLQLSSWGIKHHELIMGQKPSFDILIDDKAVSAKKWRKINCEKISGVIAGSFDVLHPGYIRMFKDAKNHCNHLTIALHGDPSLYNNKKIPPVLSPEEREDILLSIKYIDNVVHYSTEKELENLLKEDHYNVRIIGTDYSDKKITGRKCTDRIIFHKRDHEWSTTKYKKMIFENYERAK